MQLRFVLTHYILIIVVLYCIFDLIFHTFRDIFVVPARMKSYFEDYKVDEKKALIDCKVEDHYNLNRDAWESWAGVQWTRGDVWELPPLSDYGYFDYQGEELKKPKPWEIKSPEEDYLIIKKMAEDKYLPNILVHHKLTYGDYVIKSPVPDVNLNDWKQRKVETYLNIMKTKKND